MTVKLHWFLFIFCIQNHCFGQPGNDSTHAVIAFVSDTQAPMWIETLWLKSNQNALATKLIFSDIVNEKPACLFILGDVVSLGRNAKRWTDIDQYLAMVRGENIPVYAILGNHDVMGSPKTGEMEFKKRFPDEVNTGSYKVIDSTAIILLNSNFTALAAEERKHQQDFYSKSLDLFDKDPAIKVIIVTCHHAPYSNSKTVGSNKAVQQSFVLPYIQSRKAKLFLSGHAHDFEHFKIQGKFFITLGGGGGLHQPLRKDLNSLPNQAIGYAPQFHYLLITRNDDQLTVTSRRLKDDFTDFETGYYFTVE
jgi:Icc-related predicted phosphoesterase